MSTHPLKNFLLIFWPTPKCYITRHGVDVIFSKWNNTVDKKVFKYDSSHLTIKYYVHVQHYTCIRTWVRFLSTWVLSIITFFPSWLIPFEHNKHVHVSFHFSLVGNIIYLGGFAYWKAPDKFQCSWVQLSLEAEKCCCLCTSTLSLISLSAKSSFGGSRWGGTERCKPPYFG